MTGPGLLTPRSGRVAGARRLLQGKHRKVEARFLVEGPQAVREAFAAGRLVEVFVTPDARRRHAADLDAADRAGIPVRIADAAAVASLTSSVTPQGVVGVASCDATTLDEVLAASPRLVVLLHEARDPGNTGAVVRVADAAGADAVVVSAASVDPTNDKCVRASTGSVFHLPVLEGGATADLVETLRAAGLQVLAADVTPGAVDLDAAADEGRLARPTAWLFGNEAHGLPVELLAVADAVVRIPIHGRAESLNLATAAAVCLYASARAMRRPTRG